MANNKLLVEERQTDLGNFTVGRLLPFRKKRQVGPFTFIDQMGPAKMGNGNYLDVDQHPHIGLGTLTYFFEGEMEHRDSTGSRQIINPGDVGFMNRMVSPSEAESISALKLPIPLSFVLETTKVEASENGRKKHVRINNLTLDIDANKSILLL